MGAEGKKLDAQSEIGWTQKKRNHCVQKVDEKLQ